MKITDIKQQVKRADRYSIFIDEKYVFSLSESALLDSGLRLGQELSDEQLVELKDTSVRDKAYSSVLNLIARRQRSEWEVRDYLRRKEYDEPIAEEVVSRLYRAQLLDDMAFARMWVDNRRQLKSSSKRRLVLELRQKHVEPSIIEAVLEDDENAEASALGELIRRKRRQSRYQDDQKLMQYLVRQGFNYGDAKEALKAD